jgi:cytidylate kinase
MEGRKHLVVAISRELGAGGSVVGQSVAGRLGLRYLDRAILEEAARRLNEPEETLESVEERGLTFGERFLNAFAAGTMEAGLLSIPPRYDREVLTVESEIIRHVADEYDCVVVGRGAVAILTDRPGLLRVFFHAPVDFRVARLRERRPELKAEDIPDLIRRSDHERSRFMRMLSELEWSDARRYDLSLDTGTIGLQAATEIVVRAAEEVRSHLSA